MRPSFPKRQNSPPLYEYSLWRPENIMSWCYLYLSFFIFNDAVGKSDDTTPDDRMTVNNQLYRMWKEVVETLYHSVTAVSE